MVGERVFRGRRALWVALALFGALALSVAASVAMSAAAGAQSNRDIREYQLPEEIINPEGIVFDEQTRFFYGGSAVTNGAVYRARLSGETEVFMQPGQDGQGNPDPTRTQTHGFDVDDEGRLYIAGVTTGLLHVYDLNNGGEKIAQFDFNGPIDPTPEDPAEARQPYINDLDIAPNGDLYITDSNRPFIYRITEDEIDGTFEQPGTTTPANRAAEAIRLNPEVNYEPNPENDNALEANGITFTPDGRQILFGSLDNQELYRLTPPGGDRDNDGSIDGGERVIREVQVGGGLLGDLDGLEFINGDLYEVDNDRDVVIRIRLSNNFLTGNIISTFGHERFRTPTAITQAGDRALITQAEFFDTNGPPYFVVSVPISNLGTAPTTASGPSGCTIRGTNRGETLQGTAGPDVICGFGGNDRINGLDGEDIIFGGDGRDTVDAGQETNPQASDDAVYGERGADTLDVTDGQEGNDYVNGGPDTDRCTSDPGDDRDNC